MPEMEKVQDSDVEAASEAQVEDRNQLECLGYSQ